MAILLALRGGKRSKFGSSCSIVLDPLGELNFGNQDPGDAGFKILEHGGRWVVDARKCSYTVKLGSAQINAAPRSLPARAVLSIDDEKMLFVAKDADLPAAVQQLKDRLAKAKAGGGAAKPAAKPSAAPAAAKPGPAASPAPKPTPRPSGPPKTIEEDEVILDPAVFAGLVDVIEDEDVTLSPMDLAGL